MVEKGRLTLLVALTVLILSCGGYIGRLISVHSQFVLVTLSFLFTGGTLGAYFLLGPRWGRKKPAFHWRWWFLLWGPMGYFTNMIANTQSFRAFGRASETVILNYTWPVFTVLFSRLFFAGQEERTGWQVQLVEALSLAAGMVSVLLLATEGEVRDFQIANLPGVVWGLGAGASYGAFSAFSSTVTEEEQPTFLLTAILVSFVFVLPFGLSERAAVAPVTLYHVMVALAMGLLVNGVSYITWTTALRWARSSRVSTPKIVAPMYLIPVLSLVIISFLLGEGKIYQPYFFLSVMLSLISSILAQTSEEIGQLVGRFI